MSRLKALAAMAALILILIGVLLLLPTPQTPTPADAAGATPSADAAVALINARVFDGEQVHERATLVIADGRVRALAADPPLPEGTRRIDLAGKTVMPGLIDAHVHSFGSARADALRFGVTTLLDMFRPPFDFARTHAERDDLAPTDRADLYSAGFLATAPGGHGTQYGIEVPTLTAPEQAADWVADRKAEGSDWIKIVIEPGWGNHRLPTLDAPMVEALVDAAHEHGLLAVAHVSTAADAEMAVDAGIDGLVHLFADQPLSDALIRKMLDRRVFVVPTLAVHAAMLGGGGADALIAHPVLGARLSEAQRQGLAQHFPGAGPDDAAWARLTDNAARLHRAGVPLLAGTDAPNPGTAHGVSIHHELQLLVSAGLSPADAISAATVVAARAFGLDGRGCLQPGCRADLLIVDGNPLDEVQATANIAAVWKNGHEVEVTQRPVAAPAPAPAADRGPVDLLSVPGRWMPAADDFMGGASSAALEWARGDGHGPARLIVRGRLAAGFPFPYAGAMWMASEVPMQPVDYSHANRLRLQIDGQPSGYTVMFFAGASEAAQPVRVELPPEPSVELDLDTVAGLDLTRLRAIGVFATGAPAPVEFSVIEARLQ